MNNKLVLITGGSSGIGKATAFELLKSVASLILQARNQEKLEAAARDIDPTGQRVHVYSTDLTNQAEVERTAEIIIANHGLPDIVVNSAGSGEWLSFDEASISHFKETMDSPYLATAYTCKVFYNKMQERGRGDFIIINSAACYFAFPGATGYLPARWALLGLAKALQADLHSSGFNISMVVLGKVDSPYFNNNPISEQKIPRIVEWLVPTMSEKDAGKIIARTAQYPVNQSIYPFVMRIAVWMNGLFPGLFRSLMRYAAPQKTTHQWT